MRNKAVAVLVLISVIISSVLCCGCSGSGAGSKEVPKIDVNGPVILGSFKGEDIEWIVLDVQDGKALLLSKYCIDSRVFNTRKRDISWKLCILRTWLNADFYNSAFTSGEKQIILKTELPKDDVTDRIFLLSGEEVMKYLPDPDYVYVAYPTKYAMERGVVMNIDNSCGWWVRTPGMVDTRALVFGSGQGEFVPVNKDCYGVRPAMWVSIES
jgi:hypothetical protein